MDVSRLSAKYTVRRLTPDDVEAVFALSLPNTVFYQYHPPLVTRESILEDMQALPPHVSPEDKYYIGCFCGEELVAIMDLILGYPQKTTAFIGLFMMEVSKQGKGIGTQIITDAAQYLRQCGIRKMRLGIDDGNPQSEAFWTKNKFVKTGEQVPSNTGVYVLMERTL